MDAQVGRVLVVGARTTPSPPIPPTPRNRHQTRQSGGTRTAAPPMSTRIVRSMPCVGSGSPVRSISAPAMAMSTRSRLSAGFRGRSSRPLWVSTLRMLVEDSSPSFFRQAVSHPAAATTAWKVNQPTIQGRSFRSTGASERLMLRASPGEGPAAQPCPRSAPM